MEKFLVIQIATWIITLVFTLYIIYRFSYAKNKINSSISPADSFFKLKWLEPLAVIRVEFVIFLYSISMISVANGIIEIRLYNYLSGSSLLFFGIVLLIYCLGCIRKIPYKYIGILYDALTSRPVARRVFGYGAPWRIEPGYTVILWGFQIIEVLVDTQKRALKPKTTKYLTKDLLTVYTNDVKFAGRIKPGYEIQVLNYDGGEEAVFGKAEELYQSSAHSIIKSMTMNEFVEFNDENDEIEYHSDGVEMTKRISDRIGQEIDVIKIPFEVDELVIGDPEPEEAVLEKYRQIWESKREADSRNAYMKQVIMGRPGKKGKNISAKELAAATHEYHLQKGWKTDNTDKIKLDITGLDDKGLKPWEKTLFAAAALERSKRGGKKTK
jgi:hypothetical protein